MNAFRLRQISIIAISTLLAAFAAASSFAAAPENLVVDGSFEQTMPPDQFGHVFKQWGGWKYEGDCEFRVGQVAHHRQDVVPAVRREPAENPHLRRRSRACRRALQADGLDSRPGYRRRHLAHQHRIRASTTNTSPEEKRHVRLDAADLRRRREGEEGRRRGVRPLGAGLFLDRRRVAGSRGQRCAADRRADTRARKNSRSPRQDRWATTRSAARSAATRTCRPGARAMPAARSCMRPGRRARAGRRSCSPRSKTRARSTAARSSPSMPPTAPRRLRLDKGFAVVGRAAGLVGLRLSQGRSLYRFRQAAIPLYDRDARPAARNGYWTRVNYETLVPPGKSTLVLPLAQLYVGEKARPGRKLLLNAITQLVLGIGDQPAGAAVSRQHPPGARHRNGRRRCSTGCTHSTLARRPAR